MKSTRSFKKYLPLFLSVVMAGSAQQGGTAPEERLAPLEPGVIEVDGAPWSVAIDGDMVYFTLTGKVFEPGETKEDGFIGQFRLGENTPGMLTKEKYMKSPRGLMIEGDLILVTDADYFYSIDKKTGKMAGYANIGTDGPLSELCDVARMKDRLIVTCTDKNRLYFVDTTTYTFAEFVPKEPVHSPTGVVWDAENNIIYVAEGAEETDDRGRTTPSGRLLAITPLTGEVTELNLRMDKKLRGKFMGLALNDGELYFSDWSQDGRPEAIRKYNLKTQEVANVATAPMKKVGDFVIRGNQLIIPALEDKKIYIANLPRPRR